jgi:hypothetical protein
MWYWVAAVASAAILFVTVRCRPRNDADCSMIAAIAGLTIGFVICMLVGSIDPEGYSCSIFGAHISLSALGVISAVTSALSGSYRALPLAISGTVTVASILMIYLGLLGFYPGTLLLTGLACASLVLTDIGPVAGPCTADARDNILMSLSVAGGTALIWLAAICATAVFTDLLDVIDAVSGASFVIMESIVCSLACRNGGYRSAAVTASILTVIVGSISMVASLLLKGMMI